MTYGEKYKEAFGYYPDVIPCPADCPKIYNDNMCVNCNYLSINPRTEFKEETKDEEKETDRPCDRSDLSPIDIYNYLRTANPSEYGVIYALASYKISETMNFEDFLDMVFANLFAVSDKFDAEVMIKAQDMILKYYKKEV